MINQNKQEKKSKAATRDNQNESANAQTNDSGNRPKLSEQINEMSIDEEVIPQMMGNNNKSVTKRVRKGLSLQQYLEIKAAAGA